MISRLRANFQVLFFYILFMLLVVIEYTRMLPGAALCGVLVASKLRVRPLVLICLGILRDALLLVPFGLSLLLIVLPQVVSTRAHGLVKHGVSALTGSLLIFLSNWLSLRHVTWQSYLMPGIYVLICIWIGVREQAHTRIEQLYESSS